MAFHKNSTARVAKRRFSLIVVDVVSAGGIRSQKQDKNRLENRGERL